MQRSRRRGTRGLTPEIVGTEHRGYSIRTKEALVRTLRYVPLIALLACASDPAQPGPPPPPPIEFSTTTDWYFAGGTLELKASEAVDATDELTLRLGDVAIALEQVDDHTWRGDVPTTMQGEQEITLTVNDDVREVDPVMIHGATDLAVTIDFPGRRFIGVTPHPLGGNARFFIPGDQGVARVNLDAPNFEYIPGMSGPSFDKAGRGPTPDPDVWIFSRQTEQGLWNAELWRIGDGIAEQVDSFVPVYYDDRRPEVLALLPGNRILWSQRIGEVIVPTSPELSAWQMALLFSLEGGDRVVTSAQADRAVIEFANELQVVYPEVGSSFATPVFEYSTGQVAYSLPYMSVGYAAFSADGSLLAVDSMTCCGRNGSVRVHDAANGDLKASLPTSGSYLHAIDFDPRRPYLYLLDRAVNGASILTVVSTSTWETVGRISVPVLIDSGIIMVRLVHSDQNGVWVVRTPGGSEQIGGVKVSLPPAQ